MEIHPAQGFDCQRVAEIWGDVGVEGSRPPDQQGYYLGTKV